MSAGTWGGGYVTDVGYLAGFYPQQSPDTMVAACLIAGYATEIDGDAERRERLHYLELGCGQGFGALVLAASNPGWRVTAIDFNPGQIAAARRLAADGGVDNIAFLEADLSTLAEDAAGLALAEVDVASLHGLWSWVPPAVQDGVVRLLRSKMRAGGIVHCSYNALPAWQGGIGLQRLLREAGIRAPGRSDRQVVAARQVAASLVAAGARNFSTVPLAATLIGRLEGMAPEYLAHEFMNSAWAPCFHADVAARFAEAKLDWVGSCQPLENFPDLMMTEAQRAVHDGFDDPIMRELVKDCCIDRALRHDLFVRGARRLSNGARDEALGRLTLMLAVRPDSFAYKVDVPAGEATMREGLYRPMVEALARRPHRVAELLALPEVEGHRLTTPEAVAMLLASGQTRILGRPDAPPDPVCGRFNSAAARRFVRVDNLNAGTAAASVRLGSGLVCGAAELFLLDRIRAAGGMVDPAAWTAELGAELTSEGRAVLHPQLTELLAVRQPIWRAAGLI